MSRSTVRLVPRKRPQQGRSQATYDAILEAAARILENEGRGALTTNRVAERAGVSIGSLYQYFPAREAILAELICRIRHEMHADFVTASNATLDGSLTAAVDALISASLRHHLKRPILARLLEQIEDELPFDTETTALKSQFADMVVSTLARHGVANTERTAFDLIAISHGLSHAAVRAAEMNFDDLHSRIRRAVLGYLDRRS